MPAFEYFTISKGNCVIDPASNSAVAVVNQIGSMQWLFESNPYISILNMFRKSMIVTDFGETFNYIKESSKTNRGKKVTTLEYQNPKTKMNLYLIIY